MLLRGVPAPLVGAFCSAEPAALGWWEWPLDGSSGPLGHFLAEQAFVFLEQQAKLSKRCTILDPIFI